MGTNVYKQIDTRTTRKKRTNNTWQNEALQWAEVLIWILSYYGTSNIYTKRNKNNNRINGVGKLCQLWCVCVCVAITVRSLKLFLLRSLSRVTIVMLINTVLRFTIHTKRISNHTANLVQYFCLFVCWFIYLIFVWKYAHIHNMPSYTYLIVVFFSLDFRRL